MCCERKYALVLLIVLPVLDTGCGSEASGVSDTSERPGEMRFVDVTVEAGLGDFIHRTGAFGAKWFPETMGGAGGFIDYNGDDWLDILLVGGGTWPEHGQKPVRALWLYRNNQDGSFTDVTEEVGLGRISAYGFGVTAADYDNDGDEDFFVTTLSENLLFRNDDGRFVEVGRETGLAGEPVWSTSAIFFDADRDGWLDVYVGNYVVWSSEQDIFCTVDGETKSYCQPTLYTGLPGNFYRNRGDGTFTEMTKGAGFTNVPGKTLGVAEFDYNRDGWPDLIVANDTQRDLLFQNMGDGSFAEIGVVSGIAFDKDGGATGGMGVDAGVVDSGGEESIFVGNFSNEMIGVFRHEANGAFLDRAATSKIGRPSLRKVTFGLFLFDVDLDGDLDLFAANGNIREDSEAEGGVAYRQEAQLFLNQGDGEFVASTPSAENALAKALLARGAAYADYDRDGDLDILVIENGGHAQLWRNEVHDGRSLRVHLQGRDSNRDGLGAQVDVTVGDWRMRRRVRTGSSYLSQSEKAATFGLGVAEQVDTLTVRWPSGRVDRFANVEARQEIRVVEGEDTYERLSAASQTVADDAVQ